MSIRDQIQKYCAYQERCRKEVKHKLISIHCPENEIELIIRELIDEDYLNENRFIASFTQGKINAKGWGKNKIRFELIKKGISDPLIQQYFNQLSKDLFTDNVKIHYDKWIKTHTLTSDSYPKLIRHLMSKGFDLNEIQNTINHKDN